MQTWEEIAYAKRDGREEGRIEGINEAKEAKQEAETEKRGVASKMKSAGVSTENISEWLGLSKEEILKL